MYFFYDKWDLQIIVDSKFGDIPRCSSEHNFHYEPGIDPYAFKYIRYDFKVSHYYKFLTNVNYFMPDSTYIRTL
jgi:hypothetical protein